MTTRGVDINVSEHEARVFEDVFKPALFAMLTNMQCVISAEAIKKADGLVYSIVISIPSPADAIAD